MSSKDNHQGHGKRATLLVGCILSISAFVWVASSAFAPDGDSKHGRAIEARSTSLPLSGDVPRFDHSGVPAADPMGPDTAGASIAAYGN